MPNSTSAKWNLNWSTLSETTKMICAVTCFLHYLLLVFTIYFFFFVARVTWIVWVALRCIDDAVLVVIRASIVILWRWLGKNLKKLLVEQYWSIIATRAPVWANKDILGHALIWNWIVWCGQVNVWHELELSKLHSVTRFAWDVQGVTWVIYKLQYFRKLWDNTIVLIWSSQCKSFWLIPQFLHMN